MAVSLLNELSNLTSTVPTGSLASRLGTSDSAIEHGARIAGVATLAGLATRARDSTIMQEVFALATGKDAQHAGDAASIVGPTAGSAGEGLANASFASHLMTLAFGTRGSAVTSAIAQHVGLPIAVQSTLMGVGAPLALSVLSRHIKDEGLDAAGLGNLLSTNRAALMSTAPPALGSLLATEPALAETAKPVLVRRDPANWLLPLLGLAAAIVVAWVALHRHARQDVSVVDATGIRAESAAGAVVAPVAAAVERTLPNGTTLHVGANGIESRMIGFITDPAQQVNDTTWFEFDRLRFATNSADLLPESTPQLRDVASVLIAYPNVNVKIGGYTDSTGDPQANQRLSQDRADHVRAALIADGIADDRLQSQGYGDTHPVADNSTDEGRAKNRRIALRVTKK